MAQLIRPPKLSRDYAARCPWIELVRRPQHADRSFAGKVHAFNAGLERVSSLDFEVIGNLDADLSFESDYLEFLIRKFSDDPKLGVAGTPFTEDGGYDTAKDSFEGENYVAGGCQLFRRKCFEEIGGYVPNRSRRRGLDCRNVCTHEGMESPILCREAISSLSNPRYSATRNVRR